MKSIERKLLLWILGTLLLGSAMVALTAYAVTLAEMNEVFDSDLRHVAEGLAHYHRDNPAAVQGRPPVLVTPAAEPDDTDIETFAWDRAGRRLYASDARVEGTYTTTPGLSRLRIGRQRWIVYTVVHDAGVVQAAQRWSSRRVMAGESAAKILPFLLALAVVVAALLIYGLRRGIRPLDDAARDIAGRSARSLAAIDSASVPAELQPMVRAINGLMAKLDRSFSAQREFLDDAAHELRTPIAALRVQLHLLEKSAGEAERAAATLALRQGVARAQRLVEQLLAVARTDPVGSLEPLAPVELGEVVRAVLETHAARAEDWGIDLGAELRRTVTVLGDAEQLAVLLHNLIDNALRFTPPGGVVDVGVDELRGRPSLWVADTGPGLAPEDRPQLFSRFFRSRSTRAAPRDTAGSGLGLAIVRAIAERHGAAVELLDRPGGPGLEVRVSFPQGFLRTR
ncbi:ATP-binding protein [Mitsuaria sp. GD03876]|uniref:sensor histidine kinase n=1 Tax=Mitsuaria sp. GD03876 TaxID=2975399 RepID=UPI0024476D69|nr:ATP-binding protein [Mitsuaria sp. GD03876]MDH0868039.1 ATP-binding protein [Mitsuaria sp. GD03876]